MKVAVLGSGAGALAVAADMSRHGRRTVMADLDGERAGLDPVAERGGVLVADGGPGAHHPVDVAATVTEALAGAELAVVVAPCDGRERWARAIAPHTTPDHTVLLVGEGGGAIVARRTIEPPTVVAETNTLPHWAHAAGPGTVDVSAKRGGVLVASLPATPPDTARVMELIGDVWSQAAATDTVWTTVLTSYDAIEDAATDVTAAQTADVTAAQTADVTAAQTTDVTAAQTTDVTAAQTTDVTAAQTADVTAAQTTTQAAAQTTTQTAAAASDAIEAADGELRALRQALFSRESRGYHDFRMAQGLTPANAEDPGHAKEDMPGALVLASSLGRAAGVPTPAIDALVSSALARLGRDLADGPPTLAALGLGGLDVTGLIGFARSGLFP